MKKKLKLQPHWIGLAAWFAIVAAAVGACSGGSVDRKQPAEQASLKAAAAQPGATLHR